METMEKKDREKEQKKDRRKGKRKEKRKDRKRDWKFRVIFTVALLIFLYSAVQLGMILYEYYRGQQHYEKLEGYTQTGQNGREQAGETGKEEFTVDFAGLKKLNPDMIAWIRFENLGISYPIVQGKDNDYYLSHDFYKEEVKCGSIFVEVENAPDFSDDNTFVYGHNMKDKSMFAKLNTFQEEQVYRENPEFLIYTEDGVYHYSIFSCYVADVGWDSFTYQFASPKAYGEWQQTVKGRSIYDTGITPKQEQKTVTLMTCTPAGENYRFLVHGALTEIEKKQK